MFTFQKNGTSGIWCDVECRIWLELRLGIKEDPRKRDHPAGRAVIFCFQDGTKKYIFATCVCRTWLELRLGIKRSKKKIHQGRAVIFSFQRGHKKYVFFSCTFKIVNEMWYHRLSMKKKRWRYEWCVLVRWFLLIRRNVACLVAVLVLSKGC